MKRRKTKRKAVTVPISSMGDIALLLIIFLVLCGSFKKNTVQLEPPKARDIAEIPETQVVVAISDEGEIFVNAQQVSTAMEVEMIVSALLKDKITKKGRTVMFKCDTNIRLKEFEPIIEAIAKGGGQIAAVGKLQEGE